MTRKESKSRAYMARMMKQLVTIHRSVLARASLSSSGGRIPPANRAMSIPIVWKKEKEGATLS
jgi:hypothetical protein